MERTLSSKERICRLCLGTLGFFVSIFDNQMEMDSLASKIMYCAAIEVKEADGLPVSVCHRCVAKVESACEFRLLCETSDAKLRRLLPTKITNKKACCGVEKEQKQTSDSNIGEHTPNVASSDERAILPSAISETHSNVNCCYPTQSNPPGDASLLTSTLQDCTDVTDSDKCLENTTENCDQGHFTEDSNPTFAKLTTLQMICVSEQYDVRHSSSTSLCTDSIVNGFTTKHMMLQEGETRVCDMINEVPPLAKESLLSSATSHSETPNNSVKINNSLTFETGSSVVLASRNNANIFTESTAQGSLLSNSQTNNVLDENSDVQSDSLLSSSDPKNVMLHNQANDISSLDSSSNLPFHGEAISVDKLGVSHCQPEIKRRLKVRRQPSHASTENAAAALIMLSNSADNNKSLPLSRQESGTVVPVNTTDKENEPATISTTEIEKVLHRKENFVGNNFGSEGSKWPLSNEHINAATKGVAEKSSVNDDANSHFKISSSISETPTAVASCDVHTFTVSEEARDTSIIKEGNSYTRKEKRENILTNIPSFEQRSIIHPQSRNNVHSGDKQSTEELNRQSQPQMEQSITQPQSSDFQESKLASLKDSRLYSKSSTGNFSVRIMHNLEKDLSTELSQTASMEAEHFYEDKIQNVEDRTKACLINEYADKTELAKETEKIGKIAEHTKGDRHIPHPDAESVNVRNLRSCRRRYLKKTKKNAAERKPIIYAHRAKSVDHQNSKENNAKAACHDMNNRKSSLLNAANGDGSISVSKCKINSCGVPGTVSECSDEACSTENKWKKDVRDSKSNTSKYQRENDINGGLSKNLAMNKYKHTRLSTSAKAINPTVCNKTGCKVEQPLRELRVLLVRLEIGASGHYQNSVVSCKPPNPSLPRTISSFGNTQRTLSNSCSLENNIKSRTSLALSSALKSNNVEPFGTSSKASRKGRRKAKYKGVSRKAKKYISQRQDTPQISSVSPTNDALNDSISKSCDKNTSNVKPHRYTIPKLSQNTRKRLSEEFNDSNVLLGGSNREETKWDSNVVVGAPETDSNINFTKTILRPNSTECDKTEETESSNQHCSKSEKGESSATNPLLASKEITSRYCLREFVFHNSNIQIDVSNNYQKASKDTVASPENISSTRKFAVSNKRRNPSLTTVNKIPRNETTSPALKMCYAPTTFSKSVDSSSSNRSVNTYGRTRPIKRINKDNLNTSPKSICEQSSRASRTLTIESYRKLRQAELHNSCKLNSSNNMTDNNAEAFHSQELVEVLGRTTPLNIKASVSTKHGNVHKFQEEVSVNKSLCSLTYHHAACCKKPHDTNPMLQQNSSTKQPWTPQHFLEKLYIRKIKEAIPINEKSKTSHCWSLVKKDEQDSCQQILKSVNHGSEGYKLANEMRVSSSNILNSIRATHLHDGDDEQCKIIRQEILKSAYMVPQLAVLTAVSPLQSPSFRVEAKHPESESLLATVTGRCAEKVPSSDALYNSEYKLQHIQNKNDEVHSVDKSCSKTVNDTPRSDVKELPQPSKNTTKINKPIITKKISVKLHEDKRKNNLSIKERSRETPERSSMKNVLLSCTLKDNLDETSDLALRKFSTKGSNSEDLIPLPPRRTENETKTNTSAQLKDNSESCVEDTPTLRQHTPRTTHSCNNVIECVAIESDIRDNSTIHTSIWPAHSSVNQGDQKILDSCSSSEVQHNSSFESTLPPQHIIGKVVTFVDSTAEIKHKEREQKTEPNKQAVVDVGEDNSSIQTTKQTDSTIKEQNCPSNGNICNESTSITSDRQHGYFDCLWNENTAGLGMHLQECIHHKNTETSPFLPTTEANTCKSSFSGEKSQIVHSATFDFAVVSEKVPAAFVGEPSEGKQNSALLNPDAELSSTEDTASMLVSENTVRCESSSSKIRSHSESSSWAVHSKVPPLSASITNSPVEALFTPQPQRERRISAIEDKNNENQAPTRVCYTSNFIRKDLANGDVFSKTESKTFIQPKVTFSLGKLTKTSKRSKSQENYANNKTDIKFQMNSLSRKPVAIPNKFRGCNTLKEVSNQQGENNKTVVPISVTNIVKSRSVDQTVRKFNPDGKMNLEMHLNLEHARTSDAVDLSSDKESPNAMNLDFNDIAKARDSGNDHISSFTTGRSPCPNVRPGDQKVQECSEVEASSFLASKATREKPISCKLVPELCIQRTDEQLLNNKITGTKLLKNMHSNRALQKKRIAEVNAFICDICSKRFASEHFLTVHQRMHEMVHRRPYINKNNRTFRDQLRYRETYAICNRNTNKQSRQRWRVAPDNNGRFRPKRNVRQPFHRKAGFRNSGSNVVTLPRRNERLPAWKSRRCKACGNWFTNYFQFSHHIKRGCR